MATHTYGTVSANLLFETLDKCEYLDNIQAQLGFVQFDEFKDMLNASAESVEAVVKHTGVAGLVLEVKT